MSSKIEEMIDELDDYISGCKFQPLSGNSKIIVEKDIFERSFKSQMKYADKINAKNLFISFIVFNC